MDLGDDSRDGPLGGRVDSERAASGSGRPPGVPRTDRRLMAIAAALLAVPVVALMWVPSYARESPHLWGFPFFYWYQFGWVLICSACTFTAYRLTLAARRPHDGERR